MMIFYLKLTKLPFCLTLSLKISCNREFLLDRTIALCQVGPAPAILVHVPSYYPTTEHCMLAFMSYNLCSLFDVPDANVDC